MVFIFDLIIFGFLALDLAVIAVFIFQMIRRDKRAFEPYGLAAFTFLVFAWGVIFYGSFIEPKTLTVNEYSLEMPWSAEMVEATPDFKGIRIAVASDIHAGVYDNTDDVQQTVDLINSLEPDLILLAGDFVLGKEFPYEALKPLADLSAPIGVFAVMGNHDYYKSSLDSSDWIPQPSYESDPRAAAVLNSLSEAGIITLRNASVLLEKDGRKFWLGGSEELWTGHADINVTFGDSLSRDMPKILLVHNPDLVAEAYDNKVDLVIAGHTHGGQIRLPFFGPVPPLPTRLGRRFDQGLFAWSRAQDNLSNHLTQLLITSGIGQSGPRARLLAPPEVVMLEVR
jgi:uncharacterized protein